MTMDAVSEIISKIGPQFDGNRNGSLTGVERYAFLGEVIRQLDTATPANTTTSVSGPTASQGTGSTQPLHAGPSGDWSSIDAKRHVTDFLTLRLPSVRTPGDDSNWHVKGALYTHLYAGYSDSERAAVREALKDRGYSHIYLYAMNEGDYGGDTVFNGYSSPAKFRDMLQELVDDGLAPVVWLAPDDAPRFHADSARTLPRQWDSFIPAIDDLVSSYVVGLEMDEYWTAEEQDALGRHLNGLTDRPLFVHYLAGRWEGAKSSWVDGIIYQYGFGMSERQVEDRTRQLVGELHSRGKTFIAGEYGYRIPESESRRLGTAALRAGADGVGNGAFV